MAQSQHGELPCPRCVRPMAVEVYHLLDAQVDSKLAVQFANGELNVLQCTNCGAEVMVAAPMIYHDGGQQRVVVLVPDAEELPPADLNPLLEGLAFALVDSLQLAPDNIPEYLSNLIVLDRSHLMRILVGMLQAGIPFDDAWRLVAEERLVLRLLGITTVERQAMLREPGLREALPDILRGVARRQSDTRLVADIADLERQLFPPTKKTTAD